jgi:hypothetical protein|tara:strand:- start:4335 stop:4826 length:492 start_codon:yes stop_codon:yes gene_type:complete
MRKTEVFEIREIGELSTTEFVYSKVLKIDDKPEWYKFGNRKILISCKAKVKAGIDLTAIQKEDIEIKGDNIIIYLPKAKITSFNMDPNSIKTEMAEVSGMRSSFTQEEKNTILQLGEKSIRDGLIETGIYNEAKKNVISFVTEFYQQMGFEKVTVVMKGDDEK